ncbi:FAD-dependent oxidoreductase [Fictibacillus sp. 7GRE50]|uniref:FAD-dependent oxidoreductase n=1 Tax=Fictibacillus sp. 7GRE50 TaxID=2745878 RepID=UPI0018CEC71C|nr:FAD-dependent oxidoreductase [Fictibacillus sp. 7GRE50]MBH0164220.1 FAD-dependent oxidoreductase [Fictibacillus sp. 7GRE50]
MKLETVQSDITIVGGGLAGVSAAISAARLGKKVALVQNRPVLGGNSSSEIRVWVLGATGLGVNRYARETGIIGEMLTENQFLNPDGNPYYWDLVVLEAVRREPNIHLFLNTNVYEVEADGDENDRQIRSVTGFMMGSERKLRFESPMFLDCSGDGFVGFLAGAKYRIGREAYDEFQEEWAPEKSDNITLGSTMFFYTKDAGHPVKFVAPSFAQDITKTAIPMKRVFKAGDNGCYYWWIEWGGEAHLDTLYDNEHIRDELWSVIYGIWDYIKNSGEFDAENMTLEWVGSVPGKREYRRFIGDYILTQNDLLTQKQFDDNIGFGGWSIDLHPPEGMYASEYISKLFCTDGNFQIPFRSLYSKNVSNLMFAGRNISATHVAFGATRVMATCSVMGEAAGAGAALAVDKGVTPRDVYENHMTELQQKLLWNDAAMIGVTYEGDLTEGATVEASSQLTNLSLPLSKQTMQLTNDVAFIVPANPKITKVDLLVDAKEDTEIKVELWDTGRLENYISGEQHASDTVHVSRGEKNWVTAELPWTPDSPQNAFIVIRENDAVSIHQSSEPQTGTLGFVREKSANISRLLQAIDNNQLIVQWSQKPIGRDHFCIRLHDETNAYMPEQVVNGYLRPYGGPNMWSSSEMQDGKEEWLEVKLPETRTISEIQLIFNNDVNEDLNNLHDKRTPFEAFPELVKDYRIEALEKENNEWKELIVEKDNHTRRKQYQLSEPISTDAVRLVIESTNGSRFAEVVAIRLK